MRSGADTRLASRLTLGALAAFLFAVPFTLLLLLVVTSWEPLERLDTGVANHLNEFVTERPWLDDFLQFVADATDPWAFRLVVLAVVIWLWVRGAHRLAWWAAATTVFGGLLTLVLKQLVERARPTFDEPVTHVGGYSFPSGHALNSLLCTGVLLLVFLPVLHRGGQWLAYGVGVLLVLLTGFDRIALGAHYVSDVLAAWVVALACLAGSAAAFEIWRREEGHRPANPAEGGVDPEAGSDMSDPPRDRQVRS